MWELIKLVSPSSFPLRNAFASSSTKATLSEHWKETLFMPNTHRHKVNPNPLQPSVTKVFNVLLALATEMNIIGARVLLRSALLSLEVGQHKRIGSLRLWKKHLETINNLLCKLDMHQIKQVRKETV